MKCVIIIIISGVKTRRSDIRGIDEGEKCSADINVPLTVRANQKVGHIFSFNSMIVCPNLLYIR